MLLTGSSTLSNVSHPQKVTWEDFKNTSAKGWHCSGRFVRYPAYKCCLGVTGRPLVPSRPVWLGCVPHNHSLRPTSSTFQGSVREPSIQQCRTLTPVQFTACSHAYDLTWVSTQPKVMLSLFSWMEKLRGGAGTPLKLPLSLLSLSVWSRHNAWLSCCLGLCQSRDSCTDSRHRRPHPVPSGRCPLQGPGLPPLPPRPPVAISVRLTDMQISLIISSSKINYILQ